MIVVKYLIKKAKKLNNYHSTVLWYSEPADPPTAYSKPSITATPTCEEQNIDFVKLIYVYSTFDLSGPEKSCSFADLILGFFFTVDNRTDTVRYPCLIFLIQELSILTLNCFRGKTVLVLILQNLELDDSDYFYSDYVLFLHNFIVYTKQKR